MERPGWEDVVARASRPRNGVWHAAAITLSVCAAGVLAPSKAGEGFMVAIGPAASTIVVVRARRRGTPRDPAAAIDAVRVRYERRHLGAAAAESAVRALLTRGGA